MRLPSKQVLLRMYPTWDVSKQKRMSARISVKHGQAFLRLLRSGSSKISSSQQQRSPSTTRRGKHKLSPGADERHKKRFKVDAGQLPHEEVSSNSSLMEGKEKRQGQQVRLTRSTSKLQGHGRVSSHSTSTLQSGTESGPTKMRVVHKQQHAHHKGSVDVKGILEDESTVSSSLGPQSELFQENSKTSGEQASLSSIESIATNERGSKMTVNVQEHGLALKHKRKSLWPRKILRMMESDKESESIPGTSMEKEWLSQSGDSERSIPTNEASVPESSQEHPKVFKPEQEMLSRCNETPPAGIGSPSLMEPEEQAGQLNLLLDQDPMLAEGNFSCSSEHTMVPSSSQGDKEIISFPGLRFQSIQDHPSKDRDTGDATIEKSSSFMGEGFAELVDSSLVEDTFPGGDVDNLLPGLNLVHVGRAVAVGDPQNDEKGSSHEKKDKSRKVKKHKHKSPHKRKKASSARQLDMQDGDDEAIGKSHLVGMEGSPKGRMDRHCKKGKGREHKQKLHHKSEIKSTPPGKFSSCDQSSPLPKSPVFGRILPASNWAGIENPVMSPCQVRLVDHLNSSQKNVPPKECSELNTGARENASEMLHGVHQACQLLTTSKEQNNIEDAGQDVHMSEQDVDTFKRTSEPVVTPLHPSRLSKGEKSAEVTSNGNQFNSHTVEGQSSPSNQASDGGTAEGLCGSAAHSPNEQKGQEQHPSDNPEIEEKMDTPSVKKDDQKRKISGKIKKSERSKKMYENSPRGAGGWEQSLRQHPQKVTLFQVGSASKTPKKGASKVSPKKETYRRLQQEIHSEVLQREKSNDASPSIKHAVTPMIRGWRKKTPREVAKPPPLDMKGTEREGASTSRKKIQIKEETKEYGSICRGQLVFGKMKGFCWWPGRIVHHHDRNIRDSPPPLTRWVQWFGDDKYSLMSLGQLVGFEDFPGYFSVSTFQKLSLYQKACYEALNVAAKRAGKEFAVATPTPPAAPGVNVKERQEYKAKMLERFKEMQDWAYNHFLPEGSDSIQPSEEDKQIPPIPELPPPSPVTERKRSPIKHGSRNSPEKEPFEDKREERMKDVRAGKWTIEDICIGCGSTSLTAKHPLFVGGLCEVCRIEYLEVAYLYDCEGFQAHCCICAEGNQITLCDNRGCYHSYCTVCMDYLVGPQESKRVSEQEPWSCYLCSAKRSHGYLTHRDDWQDQLVDFFNRDHVADFEPLRMYKPLLLADRPPIRVLSLFDGLGTGMLVLKELGFDVECYYASEVSEEAITVAAVRLKGQIKQVGDVQKITPKELKSWGPFDLLIGGSPCNDLSNVNPARKGLAGGTGLLFFEFYRILRDLQPLPDDPRPFFWLFENVVSMGRKDKLNICRFLQCNPVMIDSRHVSPTHRARYYWGNLPGMHRPYVAGADNPLCLQECLEPHCDRQAQFSKVGTITTNSNSIPQTKNAILPVIMNGKEDGLWSTELERLFGFPDHYTDVGNLSRTARQKLLGKAWSVPVIKHLMAPLKDYFACNGRKE